jgi:hypothetical protein
MDSFDIECADLGIVIVAYIYLSLSHQIYLLSHSNLIYTGTLQKLKVWHDNSGAAPGWFLNHISVKSGDSLCHFPFHKWYPFYLIILHLHFLFSLFFDGVM